MPSNSASSAAVLASLVLGSLTEAESPQAVLADYLLPPGKPVLGGWPSGHGRPHQALPFGVPVELDVDQGHLIQLQTPSQTAS